jgi:hypothetical protein
MLLQGYLTHLQFLSAWIIWLLQAVAVADQPTAAVAVRVDFVQL